MTERLPAGRQDRFATLLGALMRWNRMRIAPIVDPEQRRRVIARLIETAR